MKKFHRFAAAFMAAAALFISGCSSGESHEKIADDAIVQMEKMAAAVTAVKDKPSAEKAVADLKSVAAELKKIAARAKAVGAPSPEVKAKIEAKMKDRQEAITKSMAGMQAALTKAGPEAMQVLMSGMAEFGQSMEEVGKAFAEVEKK